MSAVAVEQIQLIDLAKLEVHPSNPRKDVGDLTELAASIKSVGLIEPIVAVKKNGTFQVVAGSRRLAAAKKAHIASIPVRVMELDEAEATAAALIENLQRKDLNPLEQAEAFRGWLALTGKTQKELAEKIGLAPSTIANALRLLEAPKPVKDALATGRITAAHARVALELRDPALASKLKFGALDHETVDDLKADVQELNHEWLTQGGGAAAAAKAFLEASRRPNLTITWRAQRDNWQERQAVDLEKALGKPPAEIVGWMGEHQRGRGPTPERHDAKCECRARAITVRENYNAPDKLVFSLEPVCIDAKGWKRARIARRDPSAAPTVSPAVQAREARRERARAEKHVTEAFKVRDSSLFRDRKPIYERLAKGQIPAEVARAIAYLEIAGQDGQLYFGDDDARALAWQRIIKMPAKKLSKLAASLIADRLDASLVHTPEEPDLSVLAYFGVKGAKEKQQTRLDIEAEANDPAPGLVAKKRKIAKKAKR